MESRRTGGFDLIIFDSDGVLVDSEPVSNRIFAEYLNEIGLPITYEECVQRFVGRSMISCIDIIENQLGHRVPESFGDDILARTLDAFRSELQPTPGVLDALQRINVSICVASSGAPTKLQTALTVTGLIDRFNEKLFTASQVQRGKPFPDLFLYAADAMGASPARCAVVEDALVGVQAGLAAGMTVFGFAPDGDASALAAAGAHVFTRMDELPTLLGQSR